MLPNGQEETVDSYSYIVDNRYVTTKRTKSRLAGELCRFMQQYARKARASEANDPQCDRKLEKRMQRLSPSELSDLLSEAAEEPDEPAHGKG
jgi:hypothetical protein